MEKWFPDWRRFVEDPEYHAAVYLVAQALTYLAPDYRLSQRMREVTA